MSSTWKRSLDPGRNIDMGSTWTALYRVRVPNLVDHDEPDAERLAREVIEEEGLLGLTEPEDWELLSIDPLVEEEAK